jgi:hypothetical protein
MGDLFENLVKNLGIMVLSVAVLLGGCYLLLLLANVWLRFKMGSREQEGLCDLFIEAQRQAVQDPATGPGDADPSSAPAEDDRQAPSRK